MERVASVKRSLLFVMLCALVGSAALLLSGGQSRAALKAAVPMDGTEPLPAGASVQTVLSNMDAPVAMAFDPAGRLFYTEKSTGRVRLYENGALQATPVITFTVDSDGERGLLGITIDPDFNTNHYIYVYYTCGPAGGCPSLQNQVVRFEEHNGVGSNPTVVFFSTQSAPNHNGGNIHFGPDGKLYISVGDNGNAANSQDVTVKNGKMHRINGDGTIPPDNPVFTQTGALPSLFAMGLRNSFDFAFDPVTLQMFASENGPGCDDEMNRIEGAYNYGWRASYPCDDPNPSPTYNTIPPLWYLPNGLCCEAPTGVGFYTGDQVTQWHNELFMCSYNTGALRHMYLDATRRTLTAVNRVQGVTCNMDIETGPDGALWYLEGGGYTPGTLKKIIGPGGGSATATSTATAIATDTNTTTTTRTSTPTRTITPTRTATPTITCTPHWVEVSNPDLGVMVNQLNSVSVLTSNDVWAVGVSDDQPLVKHWNGSQWSVMATPSITGTLFGVEAVGQNDVWAVGNSGEETLIMHWNGSAWSRVSSPNPGDSGRVLRGVTAVSANDVWAVGYYWIGTSEIDTLIMHWDGTTWTQVASPNPGGMRSRLYAVAASAPNDVWAVGTYYVSDFSDQSGMALHWDGTQWNLQNTPATGWTDYLQSVVVVAPNDAWAVGYTFQDVLRTYLTLTMHWNGTQWSIVPSPNPAPQPYGQSALFGVSGTAFDDVWAVGSWLDYYNPPLHSLIMHWNGVQWGVLSDDPGPSENHNTLMSVDTTQENGSWAVGNSWDSQGIYHSLIARAVPQVPCVSPTPTPCPMNFSDVQPTDWFYEYVQCLYCRGALTGYSDGTFRPYNDTTRGQMTKIVVLGFGIPTVTPTTPTFTDVLPGSAFYEYVETAAAHDIVSGYGDGTFRPNNNVTRGQLSKITTIAGTEAFGWDIINPPAGTFSDVQPGSPFYTYVETAACHGIISGYADGTFRPGNNATRAQISKIVCLAVRNPPPCTRPEPTATPGSR